MTRSRYLAMAMACTLATFLSGSAALARDRSFAAVLDGLNRDYHVQPQKVPGMWLAKCIIKVVPKHGVSRLDFVLYEGQKFHEFIAAPDLEKRIQTMLGSGWSPFVQVDSSKDKERVLIFARPDGRRMDLFILTCEPGEGVAMFLRVKPKALKDALEHPASLAKQT